MNSSHNNGDISSAELLSNDTQTDWRSAALNEALQAEAYSGDSEDALLRAIRRNCAGCFTVMMWLERTALLDFCGRSGNNLRSLMPGRDFFLNSDKEQWLYVGWYALEWQSVEIEIAFAPRAYDTGHVIFLARDEETLKRFAQLSKNDALRPRGKCLIYNSGWESAPDLDKDIGSVTWDDIVLPPQLLYDVRVSVEAFFANREIYQDFGFAWRRGLLLIGPPGTGKTMISKAAAAALPDVPFLYVRDLGDDYDKREAIETIFKRARQLAPCILAFEDLDGFLNDSNRTLFLNELDGFKSNEGVFVIASSNHPDKIDEALLRRPSRFDRVFHIGLPTLEERREYSRQLLSRSHLAQRLSPSLDVENLAERLAQKSDGFTPAYLKEAFTSAALLRAHEGARILDEHFEVALFAQIEELKKHLKRSRNPVGMTEMRGADDTVGLRRASS